LLSLDPIILLIFNIVKNRIIIAELVIIAGFVFYSGSGVCQTNSASGWHQAFPTPACGESQYRIDWQGTGCLWCNFVTWYATKSCR